MPSVNEIRLAASRDLLGEVAHLSAVARRWPEGQALEASRAAIEECEAILHDAAHELDPAVPV